MYSQFLGNGKYFFLGCMLLKTHIFILLCLNLKIKKVFYYNKHFMILKKHFIIIKVEIEREHS